MVGVELLGEFVATEARGHGEGADEIFDRTTIRIDGANGRDEIGQRVERLLSLATPLLAQAVEASSLGCAGIIGVDDDVFAIAAAGQKP